MYIYVYIYIYIYIYKDSLVSLFFDTARPALL